MQSPKRQECGESAQEHRITLRETKENSQSGIKFIREEVLFVLSCHMSVLTSIITSYQFENVLQNPALLSKGADNSFDDLHLDRDIVRAVQALGFSVPTNIQVW